MQCIQDGHFSYSALEAKPMPCGTFGPAQSGPPMQGTNDQVFLLSPPCLLYPPPSNVELVQSIRRAIARVFVRDNEEGEGFRKWTRESLRHSG